MAEVETTPGIWKTFTVTLAAGTATVNTPFDEVYDVVIQQNVAAPVAEGFGWTVSGGTITVKSSNGASTADLRLAVRGRY